ncbi:MAG: hypothetical protein ABW098_20940 [Candidatus Thiodiazotropha sp.]
MPHHSIHSHQVIELGGALRHLRSTIVYRTKPAERRWLACLFRSSGMDAAVAPPAQGCAVGAAEKEARQAP